MRYGAGPLKSLRGSDPKNAARRAPEFAAGLGPRFRCGDAPHKILAGLGPWVHCRARTLKLPWGWATEIAAGLGH